MQILPSPELRAFIKHYLFISSVAPLANVLRIFGDGNTGIVFCLGSTLLSTDQDKLPKTFVYGQITDHKTLSANGTILLCIVVFHPFGMNSLLGIQGTQLKNILVDSQDVLGTEVQDLQERLQESESTEGMAYILDNFFRNKKSINLSLYPMVSSATQWMLRRKGIFTAAELINYTGWQQRSLERAFNDAVGLSPKKLGGIIRLHHFLGAIRNVKAKGEFTSLVYDTGYYDQAHLIREFKNITGLTPGSYHKIENHLAVNVVLFPDENIQLQVKTDL